MTNRNYWDCECEKDYIHPVSETHCEKCKAFERDSPESMQNEVEQKEKSLKSEVI